MKTTCRGAALGDRRAPRRRSRSALAGSSRRAYTSGCSAMSAAMPAPGVATFRSSVIVSARLPLIPCSFLHVRARNATAGACSAPPEPTPRRRCSRAPCSAPAGATPPPRPVSAAHPRGTTVRKLRYPGGPTGTTYGELRRSWPAAPCSAPTGATPPPPAACSAPTGATPPPPAACSAPTGATPLRALPGPPIPAATTVRKLAYPGGPTAQLAESCAAGAGREPTEQRRTREGARLAEANRAPRVAAGR